MASRVPPAPDSRRRCRRGAGLAGLFGLLLLLVPRPGLAAPAALSPADTARVEALVGEAERAYTAGDAALAIEKLREAVQLFPDPRIIFNLAMVYEEQSAWALAKTHYELCLRAGPDAETQQNAEARLQRLAERLARGSLVLRGLPPGAEVWLDGVMKGRTPLPAFALPPGPHALRVVVAGHEPWLATVEIQGAEETVAEVALKPLATGAGPAAGGAVTVVAPPPPGRTRFSAWTWSTLATGVVALAVGGALYALGKADYDEVRGAPTTAGVRGLTAAGEVALSGAEARALVAAGERKATAGYALFGVGGAALAASAVLFIVEGTRATPAGPAAAALPRPTALPGGAGCAFGGTF